MSADFEHIERCIEAIRQGKMIILVDDEDRENEGDLVVAAEHCSADHINFMCKEGRGLICLAMTPDRVDQLRLPMMVQRDPGNMGTAFTISIEARRGVTTGISAADRAETVRVAVDPNCGAEDIVSPGHIFPLRAQRGGVLVRSGHTEGAVDLARLGGLNASGVICEIMREDGEMARMDDLETFARRHDMPILTIADLIEYRLKRELLVEEMASAEMVSERLAIGQGDGWTVRAFRSKVRPTSYYVALCLGSLDQGDEDPPVLVRAQRAQVLGDVFGYGVDEGMGRIGKAVRQIERAGRGVFLYVLGDQIGGFEKVLQPGASSSGPAPKPGEAGFRHFGLGAQVLRRLGVRRIQVLTDNPRKIIGLSGFGLEVTGSVPFEEPA